VITELLLTGSSGERQSRPIRDHQASKPLTSSFQGWITMRMMRSATAITVALGLAIAGGSAFTNGNTAPTVSAGYSTSLRAALE
jgi:hypothetical protein